MELTPVYTQRINAVIDHIRLHLSEDLSLAVLADVACFSPFHFHRIFKTLTGETIADLTLRLRLERAAVLLRSSPRMRVGDAAVESGFISLAHFSRAFKKRYGLSPSRWDRVTPLKESKNRQTLPGFPEYTDEQLAAFQFDVRVREFPAARLAYLRIANSYVPERVLDGYARLMAWHTGRGSPPTTLIGMSQDDPDITPLELCRYDFCLIAPESFMGEGDISARDFPACHVAAIHVRGDIFDVDKAWHYLFRYWLPRSRFQPDNLPAMEIYHRTPEDIGWETYDLECAIPVVSL